MDRCGRSTCVIRASPAERRTRVLPTCRRFPILPWSAAPARVPRSFLDCGKHGTRCCRSHQRRAQKQPAPTGGTGAQCSPRPSRTLRILGPNCLGLLAAAHRSQCQFRACACAAGNLSLHRAVRALATAMLDWALLANIGFSCLVSLGNCSDVDFGGPARLSEP